MGIYDKQTHRLLENSKGVKLSLFSCLPQLLFYHSLGHL